MLPSLQTSETKTFELDSINLVIGVPRHPGKPGISLDDDKQNLLCQPRQDRHGQDDAPPPPALVVLDYFLPPVCPGQAKMTMTTHASCFNGCSSITKSCEMVKAILLIFTER